VPTAEDIAVYILEWYQDARIDWDDALYRAEVYFETDLPSSMTHPLIREIKKEVSRLRKEG
jgi:hypothetical protein